MKWFIQIVTVVSNLAACGCTAYAAWSASNILRTQLVDGQTSRERLLDAALFLTAGILVALTITFLAQVLRSANFTIERKWGALGNSVDGWSFTPEVATLAGMAVALLAVVAVVAYKSTTP